MMASVNHADFAHLKIPLENILSATNNFSDKHLTGESELKKYYIGELLWSGELIEIIARRLIDKEWFYGDQDLWTDVSMLSSLKHNNLVSLVGFCYENDENIIIYRRETRGSLCQYLSDPILLTWVRRLEICVGLAHALSYIHYDEQRDFSVIHRNISSTTVYLNDNWEPKLSNFQYSMAIKALERHHSFDVDTICDTEEYEDPTYKEIGSVNHKSDIYSFGIVMFEVLCGREPIIDTNSNKYLAPLAITHYREKRLHDIIDLDLWKQMDAQSFHIFAETAYECLNEERSERPDIHEIVTSLEKALEHQNATRIVFSQRTNSTQWNGGRENNCWQEDENCNSFSILFHVLCVKERSWRSAMIPSVETRKKVE
ncbi:kinase-like domain, phloem protein 2-like protein [Tanacetum coccineum]